MLDSAVLTGVNGHAAVVPLAVFSVRLDAGTFNDGLGRFHLAQRVSWDTTCILQAWIQCLARQAEAESDISVFVHAILPIHRATRLVPPPTVPDWNTASKDFGLRISTNAPPRPSGQTPPYQTFPPLGRDPSSPRPSYARCLAPPGASCSHDGGGGAPAAPRSSDRPGGDRRHDRPGQPSCGSTARLARTSARAPPGSARLAPAQRAVA